VSAARLVLVESNTSGTGRLFALQARRLGFEPLLLAADPRRYAFVAEDAVEVVTMDTADRRALLALCGGLQRRGQLAGVTSSSDYFVAAAAHVAARLGLPGPSPLAVRRCRDKLRQRLALRRAGVAGPDFRAARTTAEAVAAGRALGWPVVVKPVRGTGSVGVRLCRDAAESASHAAALLDQRWNERGHALPARILVEEYVAGVEYSVEAFDGRVVGVTRKRLGPEPCFVEVGHDHPAPLEPARRQALEAHVCASLSALGLTFGATHTEVRLDARGPRTIEVNPRLAGGFIPELVRLAAGVDLVAATIARAAGRPGPPRAAARGAASIRFLLPPRAGTLVEARGLDAVRRRPGVVEVALYRAPGQAVTLQGDFRDRIGHVITAAEDAPSAAAAAEDARDSLQMVVGESTPALAEAARR
jgi:S-sulfo-L-cysteine synthase (3-phospho-L-serine-dependent)